MRLFELDTMNEVPAFADDELRESVPWVWKWTGRYETAGHCSGTEHFLLEAWERMTQGGVKVGISVLSGG